MKGGDLMAIVTTLYDLVQAVSAECDDSEDVLAIVADLINAGKVRIVRSSRKIRIVT
jgi:hypothetical protein